MLCDEAFGRVCLYVYLSVCNGLTFESLDLESSFFVCIQLFQGQVRISRSRLQEQKVSVYPVCGWSVFDLKAILLHFHSAPTDRQRTSWTETSLIALRSYCSYRWTTSLIRRPQRNEFACMQDSKSIHASPSIW